MFPCRCAADRFRSLCRNHRRSALTLLGNAEVGMGKTCNVGDAVAAIPDGATIMVGGFMGVGSPKRLLTELVRQGKRDLTLIANDSARPSVGVGKLITARAVRRLVTSHIGTNPATQRQTLAGLDPGRAK